MTWAWPATDPTFRGGNPRKAHRWQITMDLTSGESHDRLEIQTDGPVKLSELYRIVSEHVNEFRREVGPLTGATITGKGLRPKEMQP